MDVIDIVTRHITFEKISILIPILIYRPVQPDHISTPTLIDLLNPSPAEEHVLIVIVGRERN